VQSPATERIRWALEHDVLSAAEARLRFGELHDHPTWSQVEGRLAEIHAELDELGVPRDAGPPE
jgi:hypothetical protein